MKKMPTRTNENENEKKMCQFRIPSERDKVFSLFYFRAECLY